jgi:hypothetical protein
VRGGRGAGELGQYPVRVAAGPELTINFASLETSQSPNRSPALRRTRFRKRSLQVRGEGVQGYVGNQPWTFNERLTESMMHDIEQKHWSTVTTSGNA